MVRATFALIMEKTEKGVVGIAYTDRDFSIKDLENAAWGRAGRVIVENYWSGKAAPTGRTFSGKLLWSRTALYVRFEAIQTEPLVISATPSLRSKTIGLWDRDVCEIFIAPDVGEPRRYFEFEIAPNGEWLDVALDSTGGKRKSDWEYNSLMESYSRVEKGKVVMSMKIPWVAFGKKPKWGDEWLGNIFRCVGSGPDRGYLAWQPTMTVTPNFHVPEKFGSFAFLDR